MSSHHERFLEKRDREHEQARRLMLAGMGTCVAGLILLVVGNILVGAFHLSPRDVAYYWLIFPAMAVAVLGGLLGFFSMAAFLV